MSDTERDNTQTAADHEDLDDEALFEELEKEDDSETAFFREQRLEELKAEVTRRTQMRENEHGVYSEVMKEKTLMELTTTTERIVVHFFHKDFRRCDIMDKHLNELARTHFQTKFCKINVENAKFLVEKLKVQILPCVIAFINAIAVDRIVGFEELGNTDGFQTSLLEFRLGTSSVIKRRDNTITNVPKKKTIFGFAEEADFDDDV